MVDTLSETPTETWQPIAWQDFCQLANQPQYEKGRFYFDHGFNFLASLNVIKGSDVSLGNAIAQRQI
jgi:hypothetical protein